MNDFNIEHSIIDKQNKGNLLNNLNSNLYFDLSKVFNFN